MMKRLLFLTIIALNGFVMGQKRLNETIGEYKEHKPILNGIELTASNAKVQITAYKEDIIRIRMTKESGFLPDFSYAVIQPSSNLLSVKVRDNAIIASTRILSVIINKNPLRISFVNAQKDTLCSDEKDYGISWIGNEITAYKKLMRDEKFIGLGEKTGAINRRGTAYENWNSDVPAYALDKDPLYATIPFYIGMHSSKTTYGIFLDNSYRTAFNFGASTDNKFSSFTVTDGEMNYYFFGSQGVRNIIKDYTWLTGHAKLPPLWSLGYQQCRWSYFPDTEVMSIARNFREKKIPLDVIYLDINYMDDYKVFTFHPKHFPDPKKLVDELNKMGIHVVTIIDPGLKVEKGYFAYEEGLKNNYFITYPNGEPYVGEVWPGRSHFPDFTDSTVREWWGNMFNIYTNTGVEGFWNDMNEPAVWGQKIPDMVEFHFEGNKTNMKEAHNVYGMQMSRGTYEGARKNMNGNRPLVITRATYSGGQRYSTIWTGDNFASDDHMLMGTRIVNSLGICGFPFAGPDIGGFMGSTTRELITRWLSIGVYTPFMRNHADYSTQYREPWVFGKDWENVQREMIGQRYKFLPYIYSTFKEATETGIPVSRSLAIDYSFDEMIYKPSYENEYLFGDHILVCPVSSKEKISKIYLPEGNWYRLSTDQILEGKKEHLVESPLNDLPVFIRAGAVIPMQSVAQYAMEKTDATLDIHIYKGEEGSTFVYYEDDGTSYNFEKGAFLRRKIKYDASSRRVIISEKEGNYESRYNYMKLTMHGFDKVHKITVVKQRSEASQEGPLVVISFPIKNDKMIIHWAE